MVEEIYFTDSDFVLNYHKILVQAYRYKKRKNKGEDFMWHTLRVDEIERNLKVNIHKGLTRTRSKPKA